MRMTTLIQVTMRCLHPLLLGFATVEVTFCNLILHLPKHFITPFFFPFCMLLVNLEEVNVHWHVLVELFSIFGNSVCMHECSGLYLRFAVYYGYRCILSVALVYQLMQKAFLCPSKHSIVL